MKSNFLLIITIILYNVFGALGGDLPAEIQKCKSKDNEECVKKAMMEIFRRYPEGNPEFGMPNIAVLNLTNVLVSKPNPNSPIQINFKFIKCTVFGLENTKVLRASGFDKELKRVELDFFVPSLHFIGDYESFGKVLLLPLNGKGRGEIELTDCSIQVRIKVELEKRNGKSYLNLKKMKATMEPKKMRVNLENVFSGNPALSDSINSVINENWKDVWTETEEGIRNGMKNIIINIMSNILNELAIDDFYLD